MTQFEQFSLDYLSSISGEKLNKYLVIINGTVVTEVIENREQLNEAVTGALTINPESEIQVYELIAFEPTETEAVVEETTEEPDTEDTVEETEEVDATEPESCTEDSNAVEVSDEPSKDSDRSAKKAKKKAKKAAKLAKKAKKEAKKASEAEEQLVDELPMEETVTKKKVVKKTVKKTSAVGSTQRVAKLNKDTKEIIKEYDSIADAADDSGVHSTNISKVCRGIRGSAGGFGWKYL